MSPRAASRLETLGFKQVHDYVAAKADWGSARLPLEGREVSETRAGAHVRTDVPNCRLSDRLQAIRGRSDISAEEAMTLGPSTIRPSARLGMVERMQRQSLTNLPVTTSDGRFVGLLTLGDAEEALRTLDD